MQKLTPERRLGLMDEQNLGVEVIISHSIGYEPDEGTVFASSIGEKGEEPMVGAVSTLKEHVESLMTVLKEDANSADAYSIGHEMVDLGNQLRDLGELIEGKDTGIEKAYDMDEGDLK